MMVSKARIRSLQSVQKAYLDHLVLNPTLFAPSVSIRLIHTWWNNTPAATFPRCTSLWRCHLSPRNREVHSASALRNHHEIQWIWNSENCMRTDRTVQWVEGCWPPIFSHLRWSLDHSTPLNFVNKSLPMIHACMSCPSGSIRKFNWTHLKTIWCLFDSFCELQAQGRACATIYKSNT